MHTKIAQATRLVIKIGSSLLTNNGVGLDHGAIANWAGQIATIKQNGLEVVLVSSGAIAEGMQRLNWKKRPHALHELQAAAAIGQMGLIQVYESSFRMHGLHSAQILLTHDDLANRKRYLNAKSTLRSLLSLNVIPVINENDTVVTDEIRFGDNDTLAALVTNLIDAEVLIILTDQGGLYASDPRQNPDARLIQEASACDAQLEKMAGGAGSELGRGGMISKVRAACCAAKSGAHTIISNGREPNILLRLTQGEAIGTLLYAQTPSMAARKQWLANHLQIKGALTLDEGAIRALQSEGKSLLPIGVTACSGNFERGEVVACNDANGKEIARGLINYNAKETQLIMRHKSAEIEAILGYIDEMELIHRDNMVISPL